MKSKIVTVFIISSVLIIKSLGCMAQASEHDAFDKGNNVLGLAFGIGGHYGAYSGYSSQTPSIGIMYEKGMSWQAGPGVIGLGGYLGYKSLRYKEDISYPPFYTVKYDYKWSYIIIGARGAYHYQF